MCLDLTADSYPRLSTWLTLHIICYQVMFMGATIEKAKAAEAREMLKLMKYSHRKNASKGFRFPAMGWTEGQLRAKMKRDAYYVMRMKRVIVGTVAIKRKRLYWEVGALAILPGYQHRGLGKRLLAYAENRLCHRKADKAVLFTPKHHPVLPGFYSKRGYKPSGVVKSHGLIWVRMEKRFTRFNIRS